MDTVKVVAEVTKGNDQGYIVINKSDLKDGDKLYVEPKKTDKKPK